MRISVVLASRHPLPQMAQAVTRLLPQCRQAGAELIIARSGDGPPQSDPLLEGCRVLRCSSDATIPEVRGAGLAAAVGDWVLLTEDNCLVHPDWVARITTGTTPDADVVGGVMANAHLDRAIDAAAGFAEYGFYGPIRSPGAAPALACANVGYHRSVVADVAAWSSAGKWDAEIHQRLVRHGARFHLVPDAIVEQNLRHHVGPFCRNRFQHGRDYAVVRNGHLTTAMRLLLASASLLLPAVLTWRVWLRAGRASPGDFFRALPFTLTFFAAWSAGEAAGYLRGNAA